MILLFYNKLTFVIVWQISIDSSLLLLLLLLLLRNYFFFFFEKLDSSLLISPIYKNICNFNIFLRFLDVERSTSIQPTETMRWVADESHDLSIIISSKGFLNYVFGILNTCKRV